MNSEINVRWNEKMAFTAEVGQYRIVLDAAAEVGGENKGPRPKPLLMVSLAGCTGMDVVSILEKMKVKLKSFNVKVVGDINEEHPKKFNEMKIIYEFSGENLDIEKLNKAVKLSEEKYCGVIATLIGSVKLDFEIKILE
jgi:putative redox protein